MSDPARLLIATPVRGADIWATSVSVGYSESVRALSREMPVETLSATVTYSCDNIRARNRIAGTVLRDFPHVTHILWWDDDNWPEDRKIVHEMMNSGEDMIAAPYTNKKPPLRWIHQHLEGAEQIGKMLEVKGVGFGFTMTTRGCLESMTAASRIYTDHPHPHRIGNLFGQLYDPVDDEPAHDALLSEDYSFCKRWREIGGKVQLYASAGIILHGGARGWSARDMQGGVVG
jgi:hypothetical protein